MDCEKFNEYITEYEARRLTRKQELEFLHHKDVCDECNIVYNLVFNDIQIQDINYISLNSANGALLVDEQIYNDNYSNSICSSIMEKIQNIEQNSYNFKFYNIMNIVFGVLVFGALFAIMLVNKAEFYFMTDSLSNGTKQTVDNMNSGLSNAYATAIQNMEEWAIYIYIGLMVCVGISYLYSVIKTKNK